jgi:hypothetical protein
MLHTTGELFVSPIGLSMVTKLAPKKISGTAMGGWFLSFAMANFLAGQIAAVTGAEGNKEKPKDERETTLVEALAKHPDVGTFNEWEHLVYPDEASNSIPQNLDMITYNKYQQWVIFSKAFKSDETLSEYLDKSETGKLDFTDVEAWLHQDWVALNKDLKEISDWESSDFKNIDFESFLYYTAEAFNEEELEDGIKLRDAYDSHVKSVSKQSLDKYTNIFKMLGLFAIGIAVILALFRKPINRLMHGVE